MSTFINLIISVLAMYLTFANNQNCFNEDNLSLALFLPFSCFRTLYEISIINCARECMYRQTRCKSFNYIRSALSCSLCEEDSGPFSRNLIEKPGRTHSDIAKWSKASISHEYYLGSRGRTIQCEKTDYKFKT
ncbi:hypothetical protein ACJMK2_020382 [Sinanodonta woodiana]|uniref:Apple domain-containing protein n=1 Tax=Sinanodonta woodiana TaxID=1069815 RepID=A0ABD3TYW7_SINWO